jgi:hypothetical protein
VAQQNEGVELCVKFEIVDGFVRGYATAVVELSYVIEVHDLRESYECEAETPEEFLDLIRDDVQRDVESHIEVVLDDLGYRCDGGVILGQLPSTYHKPRWN